MKRFLQQELDEAGLKELKAMTDPAKEEAMLEQMASMMEMEPGDTGNDEEMARVLKNVLNADRDVTIPVVRRIGWKRRLAWVAAASLVLFASAYWWLSDEKQMPPRELSDSRSGIQPGRDGAILTLADGSQVILDTVRNGTVTTQGGARAMIENGILKYDGSGNELVYNTITTPKGRQYQVVLPDATIVWLNAGSSLRFPAAFTGADRSVQLTGEAFFEVAKNEQKPFRVSIPGRMEIEVLGTTFNVQAYTNEESIDATLISGAVSVKVTKQSLVLKPGQQAQNRQDKTVTGSLRLVQQVDTQKVLAWRTGKFNFENTRLVEVMRQLERWYDIEVVYENGTPDITLMGKLSRDIPLKELLPGLEELGVHARLEGRKLIIMASTNH
ncbi:FecR family protein [Pseudobacter ginsenosidimutans]|uniref:FecR family protein n=1 Tax=Pseudobacter ginsenosidimutans TaxID=661488 RepID=UPI0013154EAF|nr:FecR family protein [Pseudobacter ginsenosidimutans]